MVITPNLSSPNRPITQLIFITTARNVAPLTRSWSVSRSSGQPQPQQNSSHHIRIQSLHMHTRNSIYTTPMDIDTRNTQSIANANIVFTTQMRYYILLVYGFLPWSFSGRLRIYERCTFQYIIYTYLYTCYTYFLMRNAWPECTKDFVGLLSPHISQYCIVYYLPSANILYTAKC